ncbi:Aste57867_18036 [Aphanomyces stellatus]|uniref:Aste57867_18036 protein n=1 Tax=Aphanomyces stellatus TaxID=120398 RepID=A0A485L9X6_9STRA|nr:hypothetical protein As57867_017974 [Aphanomyces stellatus]VFT94775.1 Aste57867_18036 [Aphanomyces stellatus]
MTRFDFTSRGQNNANIHRLSVDLGHVKPADALVPGAQLAPPCQTRIRWSHHAALPVRASASAAQFSLNLRPSQPLKRPPARLVRRAASHRCANSNCILRIMFMYYLLQLFPRHDNTTATLTECGDLLTPDCDPEGFYFSLVCVVCLICTAGMMAGLTMGLLSLDQLNLQILQTSGTDDEKLQAERVLPIIKQHHLLLVTLLLFNAAANEALPVFLARLVTEAQAVVISVTCVLFFGEIIPSAIFTGKQQLTIAATLIPLVQVLMLIAYPLAWPIAKLLDYCLGEEHEFSRYKRKELKALVALHHKQSQKWIQQESYRNQLQLYHRQMDLHQQQQQQHTADGFEAATLPLMATLTPTYNSIPSPLPTKPIMPDYQPDLERTDTELSAAPSLYSMTGTHLHNDEVAIIHGAMDMSTKTVQMIMTPFEKVFMLDIEEKLNDAVMVRILASGFSRVPVYKGHRTNVVGLLLVKRLIVLNPAEEKPLKDLMLRRPIVISPDHSCYSALNLFQEGRSHLAVVTDIVSACWKGDTDIDPNVVDIVGVVTIEDVLEELIMEEIADESDSPHQRRPDSYAMALQQRGVLRAVEKFKELLARAKARKAQPRKTRRSKTSRKGSTGGGDVGIDIRD